MATYFSPEQVDSAIRFVATQLTTGHAESVTYADLLVSAGLDPPPSLQEGCEDEPVTSFVKFFHERWGLLWLAGSIAVPLASPCRSNLAIAIPLGVLGAP